MKQGQWITRVDWLFLLFAISFITYAVISQGLIILLYAFVGFLVLSIVGWILGHIAYQRGRASFEKELKAKIFRNSRKTSKYILKK